MISAEFFPTPSVIEWARVESGLRADFLAKKLAVKPEQVKAWERGDRIPTVRQVEKLADVLHRPMSVFFMPEPPRIAAISNWTTIVKPDGGTAGLSYLRNRRPDAVSRCFQTISYLSEKRPT